MQTAIIHIRSYYGVVDDDASTVSVHDTADVAKVKMDSLNDETYCLDHNQASGHYLLAPVLDDDLTKLTADNAELIMRARKAWNTGGKDALDDYCQKALTDIDKKVVKYSSFSNGGKQRAFFEKLVCQMEKAIAKANGTEEPEAEAVAVALPGDADFVSASGSSGARY